MAPSIPSPPHWLLPLATELDTELRGRPIEGVISGPGWVSLRVGGRFLWFVFTRRHRMIWLQARPLAGRWLSLLGMHRHSPFARHLRRRHVLSAAALADDSGRVDGLELSLGSGSDPMRLRVRFWPRPGALWLTTTSEQPVVQLGRMEGAALRPVDEGSVSGEPSGRHSEQAFDAAAHHLRCKAAWEEDLVTVLRDRLRRALRRRSRRLQRRHLALSAELEVAERDQRLRAVADLLAAHLHTVRSGMEQVELTGFDGETVVIPLDPSLAPATNLEHLYRRAGRAERKREQVATRLADCERERSSLPEESELVLLDGIDPLLAFAEQAGLEPLPSEGPQPIRQAGSRGKSGDRGGRLPYWRFQLAGEWELRVGRSARDNDQLTLHHAHGKDKWLHAQGVTGSHVVLCSRGRPVPKAVIEMAAQVAAQYSKARSSGTVAVIVTECRYVRKPRKAPPGLVAVEREKTLFVQPKIPRGCERMEDAPQDS